MPLVVGTKLGPYEILSPLGAGGMGEVYRARDTRLGREVAIKVLASLLAEDPELKRRFEREARAVSQLSHPHICALYDVGSHEGLEYLVMELLEGQPLADRLTRGALPIDQVLQIGAEIAEALDGAHRRGIVHRDLKPANIMITKSGVKLLDFGLAKTVERSSPDSRDSILATRKASSGPLTEKGTILGTVQYMAPEQLEGKDVDSRTDIFALGCVLYEAAAGRRAFSGGSRASLIGAILKDQPAPLAEVSPLTPPALDRLVRRCLAKDPDGRWQSAADVASELKWIAEAGSRTDAPASGTRRGKRERAVRAAFFLAGLAAAAIALVSLRRSPEPRRTLRASVELPPGVSLDATDASLALSPDGRFLALAADDAGHNRLLYLRALDSDATRPLPGTEDAAYPFWSPDSRTIGFFAAAKLRKIDVGNSAVQTICDAPKAGGGSWNEEGTIVFSGDASGRLLRVDASGGAASPAGPEPQKGVLHRNPHFLPGGRSVLFTSLNRLGTAEKGICVLDLASKTVHAVLPVASEAYAVAAGFLAYVEKGDVVLQPFDPKSLRLGGPPAPLAENVARYGPRATALFSFAGKDLFAYRTQTPGRPMQLAWFGSDGRKLSDAGGGAPVVQVAVSPDGRHAAEVVGDVNEHQIWLVDLARGVRTRFTFDVDNAVHPVWSPDGRRLAYDARTGGKGMIQVKSAFDGSPPQTVYEGPEVMVVTSWSPDGRDLLFQTQSSETRSWDVGVLPLFGDRKPRLLLASAANEGDAAFSPDGRWIAFWSDEAGRTELYVTPYPGPGGKWQISSGGTVDSVQTSASWWNGNSEIDYLSPEWKMLAVRVKLRGDAPEIASPRPIAGAIPLPPSADDYSPALQRFLVAVPAGEPIAPPVTIVTNWATALEKR